MNMSNRSQRVRVPFSKEEDERLTQLIRVLGENNWEAVSNSMQNGRTPRQCRDRWVNWINVSFVKETWSPAEDTRLIQKVQEIGQHWKALEPFFPGRVSYTLRNRYAKLQKSKSQSISKKGDEDSSTQNSPPALPNSEKDEEQNDECNLIYQGTDNCINTQEVSVSTQCGLKNDTCPSTKIACSSPNDKCQLSNLKNEYSVDACSLEKTCTQTKDNVCKSSKSACTSSKQGNCCAKKNVGVFNNINDEEQGFDWSEGSWCRCTCMSNIP